MKKNKSTLALMVLLLLALSCWPAFAGESDPAFSDVGGHWARADILKCKESQLMTGYQGNLFLPDQYLSRAEALAVIVKSLGWDRQAGQKNLTEGIIFPNDLWEGFRGYVAIAVEKKILSKAEVPGTEFNKPATRIEAAVWLAQALNLSGSQANLGFTDLGWVPSAQRDMLAGVVAEGIIKGLPGNLFQPSGRLTRAEMAVILVRLIEKGKTIVSLNSGGLLGQRGHVINKYSDYFTVRTDLGLVKVNVSGVDLLIDRDLTTYGSVRRGLPVELLKSGSEVKAVRILDGVSRVYGRIRAVNTGAIVIEDAEGKEAVYEIGGRYGILDDNGEKVGLTAEDVGVSADLSLDSQDRITQIIIHSSAGRNVEGKVESIDISRTKNITIVKQGALLTYNLAEGVEVVGWGRALQLDGIKTGMDVSITLNSDGLAERLDLSGPPMVEGRVKEIDIINKQITIIGKDGLGRTYIFKDGLKVQDGSSTLDLGSVKENTDVRITLDGQGKVEGVEIIDMSTLVGNVSAIRKDGAGWISLKNDSGLEKAYYLGNRFTVIEGNNARTMDYVEEGMLAELKLDVMGNVDCINILGTHTEAGRVLDFQSSGINKITMRNVYGTKKTYFLGEGAVIKDGVKPLGLDSLKEGLDVKLILNNADKVAKIEIQNLSSVEGEVVFTKASGIGKIEILKDGGLKEVYYPDLNVPVRDDGKALGLGGVPKGVRVRLTIDGRGDIMMLEVTGKTVVEGRVTGFNSRDMDKIKVLQDNGQEGTFSVDDSVIVREGGNGTEPDRIFEGMRVAMVIDKNRCATWIDILGLYSARGQVVEKSNDKLISIKGAGGEVKTYSIVPSATVTKGGATYSLEDVREGISVELTLDRGQRISHINIF